MATELFRSVRADTDAVAPLVPPLVDPTPSLCCFRNREEEDDELSPVGVGVAMAELGGVWEEFLSEEMSTVGEGREERGVSMVEGRGMDGGFARSSLAAPVPLETSSVDKTSKRSPFRNP